MNPKGQKKNACHFDDTCHFDDRRNLTDTWSEKPDLQNYKHRIYQISPIVEMTKNVWLFIFITLISFSAEAQISNSKGDTVEISETDFTRIPTFNGAHATIFGIALGMGRAEAMEKMKNYQYLTLKADPFNPKRFYIQEASSDTGKVTLAYLKWPNYDSGLYQIIIYPPMAKYLRGQSASIIGPESLDSSSELYKTFLGKPSASPITSNIPEIKARTIMHYYPKYNIVIEEDQAAGKSTYDLVLTRKW